MRPEDELEERLHFQNVITTFRQYSKYSVCTTQCIFPYAGLLTPYAIDHVFSKLAGNHRRRKDYFKLSLADQQLLDVLGYKQKLAEVDNAILANAEFLNQIIADPHIFGHDIDDIDEEDALNEDTDIVPSDDGTCTTDLCRSF